MNRGALQSLPVQQMMPAGNPNRWNINTMRPPSSHHHHHHHHHDQPLPFLAPPNNLYPQFVPNSNSPTSLNPSYNNHIPSWLDHNQDQLPESWSQLLLGGLAGDEDPKGNMMNHFQIKKLENWEEQILCNNSNNNNGSVVDHVKQEQAGNYVYGHGSDEFHHQAVTKPELSNWSNNNNMMPNNSSSCNSPKSCVTTFSSNMLDFSNKADHQALKNPPVSDRSFECNSSVTGGPPKKARINQASSTQSTFKVRKEKLGDRITALHQLVSPFGKTDTASVLLEAIGYVRFLQSQIEALSLPYLGSGSGNMRQQQQQSLHGERNCMFPEDPGQLLNDNCMKRKGAPDQQGSGEEPKKDLRSRGLCLVPVSCTLQVGSDNGADYWAPALGGGFR